MGVWGTGNLENDEVLNWLEAFLGAESPVHFVRQALETFVEVKEKGTYLDASKCYEALGACEVLACGKGGCSEGLPEDVASLAQRLAPNSRRRTWNAPPRR
jgi:hypothetical protein